MSIDWVFPDAFLLSADEEYPLCPLIGYPLMPSCCHWSDKVISVSVGLPLGSLAFRPDTTVLVDWE